MAGQYPTWTQPIHPSITQAPSKQESIDDVVESARQWAAFQRSMLDGSHESFLPYHQHNQSQLAHLGDSDSTQTAASHGSPLDQQYDLHIHGEVPTLYAEHPAGYPSEQSAPTYECFYQDSTAYYASPETAASMVALDSSVYSGYPDQPDGDDGPPGMAPTRAALAESPHAAAAAQTHDYSTQFGDYDPAPQTTPGAGVWPTPDFNITTPQSYPYFPYYSASYPRAIYNPFAALKNSKSTPAARPSSPGEQPKHADRSTKSQELGPTVPLALQPSMIEDPHPHFNAGSKAPSCGDSAEHPTESQLNSPSLQCNPAGDLPCLGVMVDDPQNSAASHRSAPVSAATQGEGCSSSVVMAPMEPRAVDIECNSSTQDKAVAATSSTSGSNDSNSNDAGNGSDRAVIGVGVGGTNSSDDGSSHGISSQPLASSAEDDPVQPSHHQPASSAQNELLLGDSCVLPSSKPPCVSSTSAPASAPAPAPEPAPASASASLLTRHRSPSPSDSLSRSRRHRHRLGSVECYRYLCPCSDCHRFRRRHHRNQARESSNSSSSSSSRRHHRRRRSRSRSRSASDSGHRRRRHSNRSHSRSR
ncbi:uncharacterized protein BJ171DRAFT_18276 [Polychytrium aggregatum]|uniref:uncharacterized protein n=1 Tax=Polychytrium aggregatum TaxID=110093 RepID=UPI0022FEF97A|nr:uncharacterized protein BJ171DRAFT_18276 [Polychytrium aggregatum]KAI9206743.1 hypothetical protein BJ171DRAFT_18276 [Polychytrium aggregatum]